MRLAGSVAVITGASSGIGAETSRELARRGAAVVLGARRLDRLKEIVDEIERNGGRAVACQTDVTRREDVDRLIQAAVDRFGRLDALVNNAGTGLGADLWLSSDDAMERIVEVNLLAVARATRSAFAYLTRPGGVIVNVGSVAGEGGGYGLYAATKYGVRGLSDALRRDLWHAGIAVVLVEPGFIRTEMTADLRLPMPGPGVVARAIAGSIERPRRLVVVPWYYVPAVWALRLTPAPLMDRAFAVAAQIVESRRR